MALQRGSARSWGRAPPRCEDDAPESSQPRKESSENGRREQNSPHRISGAIPSRDRSISWLGTNIPRIIQGKDHPPISGRINAPGSERGAALDNGFRAQLQGSQIPERLKSHLLKYTWSGSGKSRLEHGAAKGSVGPRPALHLTSTTSGPISQVVLLRSQTSILHQAVHQVVHQAGGSHTVHFLLEKAGGSVHQARSGVGWEGGRKGRGRVPSSYRKKDFGITSASCG